MIVYGKDIQSKIENRIYLKYKFNKMNTEYNIDGLAEKIGTAKMYYVIKLIHNMDSKNRVNFGILELPEGTVKKLRPLLLSVGVVGKYKLKGDGVKTYYLNPYYAHNGKTISKELFNAFDEINGGKIY